MAVFTYLATTAFWASITTTIGVTAANLAIAVGQAATWALASAVLNRPQVSRSEMMATVDETDSPRVRAYGRNLMGGVRAFFEARNGQLFQVVVFHHGPVNNLIAVWIDGSPVARNTETGEIERYKYVFFRDGSSQGGNYNEVRQTFPTLWTDDHRLQGQATFCSVWGDPSDEDFGKVFPRGAQTLVQVEVNASRVKNLLTGAIEIREVAAFCIYDYMTHPTGWNLPESIMDQTSWIAFSNLCLEQVPLAPGGTENRYRLAGYYSLEDARHEVTARMLATCDGQIYETAEGLVGILGGAWSIPDFTITDADILSVRMEDTDPFSAYNVLQGKYVSPAHGYQPTEVQEIVDQSLLATQGRRVDMLDVEMCPSGTQLQRLMRIRFAKNNRRERGVMTTTRVGMKARYPKGDGIHTMGINAPEIGLVGTYEVLTHRFFPDGRCEIGFASLANPYPWFAATEETPLPPTRSQIDKPVPVTPVPSGATLVQERETISGDVQGTKIQLTVDDPDRDGLELWAQIAKGDWAPNGPYVGAKPRWFNMAGSQLVAESSILEDGQPYTVRYRWRGYGNWIKAGTITALANPVLPPAPTAFDALRTGANVYLDWINADDRYFRTQVLMGTTADPSAAAVIATVAGSAGRPDSFTFDGSAIPAGATRRFWGRTLNGSRVPSTPTGPVSITF